MAKETPTTAEQMADIAALIKEVKDLKRELDELKSAPVIDSPAIDPADDEVVDDRINDYVMIKLFFDGDKYKDDVYVAVNGHALIIKRGEYVKVRRYIQNLIDQSEIQDIQTNAMIQEHERLYERKRAAVESGLDADSIT